MKKGIFYRILGLILAVTMLFGLTGFTFLAPAGTSNTIGYTMDDPGQGGQGDEPTEPTEPTEPGQGDQGDKPTEPTEPTEPGQGNQGDKPTEPTQPTEPEQGDQGDQGTPSDSDIVYVTYAKDTYLEVKTEAVFGEKGAISRSTGTITFIATPDAEHYKGYLSVNLVAFANNKNDAITAFKNNDGTWSINLDLTKFTAGDIINVTAKLYGIESMPQQGFKCNGEKQENGKWAYKREITVNTFGFDMKPALSIVGGVSSGSNEKLEITEEISATGKDIVVSATGTVNGISVTATAKATVSKIDRTAPKVDVVISDKKFDSIYRSGYEYSITLESPENGPVSVKWEAKDKNGKNVKDCKSYNKDNNNQMYYYPLGETFLLSDTTVTVHIRQTIECNNLRCEVDKDRGKHWVEYSYTITDEAGNPAFINGGSGEETTGTIPEEDLPFDRICYWVKDSNKERTDWVAPSNGDWGIYFYEGLYPSDETSKGVPTKGNSNEKKVNTDGSTKFTINKGGCYGLYVNGSFTLLRYYKYDPDAPEVSEVKFVTADGLEGFTTKLNGDRSILFDQEFQIKITTNDPDNDPDGVKGTDVSGVVKVDWQLVEKPEDGNKVTVSNDWNAATQGTYKDDNNNNVPIENQYIATVTKEDKFTGYIALRVTDFAGNETIELYKGSKGKDGEFEIVDGSVLITNESRFSGSVDVGDTGVNVSAVVEVYGKKTAWKLDEYGNLIGTPVEAPYTGEWVQSATFNIYTKVTLANTEGVTIDSIVLELKSGDTTLGTKTITYSDETTSYSGDWAYDTDGREFVKLSTTNSYNPVLYATVNYTKTTEADDGGTESVVEIVKTCTVNIDSTKDTPQAVNMSSDGSAMIESKEWYNGNKKQLSSVTLGTRSAVPSAPATVYWELTYPTKGEHREYPNTARGTYGKDIAGLGDIFKNNEGCTNELFNNDYFTTPGDDYELYMFAIDEAGNISIDCNLENGVYTIPLFAVVNSVKTNDNADSENKDEDNDENVDEDDAEENPTDTSESTKTLNTEALTHYKIWWDAAAPDILVYFKNNDDCNDSEFYRCQREITVVVKDYKLDENATINLTYMDPLTGSKGTPKTAQLKYIGSSPNGSTQTYTATITIGLVTKDLETAKEFQGADNCNLTIMLCDAAGNVSTTNKEGTLTKNNNETETTMVYKLITGYDEQENPVYAEEQGKTNPIFTIDQTKPVVEVSFDNNNVQNGKYFAKGRTVTFTVTEHNFNDVQINDNPKAEVEQLTGYKFTVNGQAQSLVWTNIKDDNEKPTDVWTASYDFGKNNGNTIDNFAEEYNISIEIVDKAGNANNGVMIAEKTVAWENFVVDSQDPGIELFTDNAGTLFGKDVECTPGFSATDAFLSEDSNTYDYEMTLTRTVRDNKNQNVTTEFVSRRTASSNTELAIAYNNIMADAENDGIYTLTVRVTDLAGNSSDRTVTFTVNRNGSFYIFNDELAEVVRNAYVKKANGHYVVTEYNASPLVPGTVSIQITRDGGKPVADFKPEIVTTGVGESGLYEYDYVIDSKYFKNDGVYKVVIYSTDEAGNKSQNMYVEKEIIIFTVDSVAPNFEFIDGLQNAIVNATEHLFSAKVYDAGNLRMVEIRIDGKTAMRFLNPDEYAKAKDNGEKNIDLLENLNDALVEYTLLESDSKQHVVIIATDMAGNVSSTDAKNFAPGYDFNEEILVSTNFWARYINNTWALIGTAVGIAAIAAGIWFFVKKRNSSEETAA